MDTYSHNKKGSAFLSFIQSKGQTESNSRIKEMIKQGASVDEISKELGVSKSHVQKIAQTLKRQAQNMICECAAHDILLGNVSDLFNNLRKLSERVIISLFQ